MRNTLKSNPDIIHRTISRSFEYLSNILGGQNGGGLSKNKSIGVYSVSKMEGGISIRKERWDKVVRRGGVG